MKTIVRIAATVCSIAAGNLLGATLASAESSQLTIEAPVVSVKPIVTNGTEKIPHRSCWEEQVRVERRSNNRSATPTVLGAIIGGVVGGRIGRNSHNQPIIAGAGALLGATIGRDASHRRSSRVDYVTQERCGVDYELRDYQHITGYRVGYRYNDTVFYTRTENRPGDTIPVQVQLNPVSTRY